MFVFRQITLATGLALIGAGAAAAEPSFDCSAADSAAEKAVCASDALAELDVELARLYRLALEGPPMNAERAQALKAMQRGWIRGRDDCWKSSLGLETCVANEYALRIDALRTGYADARSHDDAGVSLGPFALDCPALGGGVSVVYINTREPLVALKWLDQAIVLPRVRAASGAKYAADAGDGGQALLWTKGDAATFAPPGGPQYDCRVDDVG